MSPVAFDYIINFLENSQVQFETLYKNNLEIYYAADYLEISSMDFIYKISLNKIATDKLIEFIRDNNRKLSEGLF